VKIYSMTATFGKLNHETIHFQEGLNVIHAPNEWGKSTWCAFIAAMLYGIDTRERTKLGSIADKERYAPWSGAPMSGRMDICWEGRDITIERSSKGRTPFGEFKAYETATGLTVRELTGANCGLQLLGVEKEVFLRAGFLRLKDLPVTQDDTLRRRLNALVTTGDETGASDDLAQKLRDLKNKCRFNRSGLLPQAQAQAQKLEDDLNNVRAMKEQLREYAQRKEALSTSVAALENHLQALAYRQAEDREKRLNDARNTLSQAQLQVRTLEQQCREHPAKDALQEQSQRLRQLQRDLSALEAERSQLPPAPLYPEAPQTFRDMDPEVAIKTAAADKGRYDALNSQLTKKPSPLLWLLAIAVGVLAAGLLILQQMIPGLILGGCAIVLLIVASVQAGQMAAKRRDIQAQIAQLTAKYASAPDQWDDDAYRYANTVTAYRESSAVHAAAVQRLDARQEVLQRSFDVFCDGRSPELIDAQLAAGIRDYEALDAALAAQSQAEAVVQALANNLQTVAPPEAEDTLTYSQEETQRLLTQQTMELRQLEIKQGQCQVQMEALGGEAHLAIQLQQVNTRITRLERTYDALTLAQQTLENAARELQRRFAPKISKRAKSLFSQLTGQRYDRLSLEHDLSVSVAADGEDTLHSAQWRSDGTVDQLYLALRLAVAEELTPDAPLILDDALVRFDEERLAAAMEILQQVSQNKQVILFSCQKRESTYLNWR